MKPVFLISALSIFLIACSQKKKIDLLIYNAAIYAVDSSFAVAEAMAVKDGKIVEVGKASDLQNKYDAKEKLDAGGKFIYPGFIDAHAHFVGYGTSLQRINLVDTKSWNEVIDRTKTFAAENPDGWLLGRGWDQNDWAIKEFPSNEKLNELFPDRPVVLTRIDGHAAIANTKALEIAGIKPGQKIDGGEIEVEAGKLTGILVDNAVDLVTEKIPGLTDDQFRKALQAAEQNCFTVGLTTVDDCGLNYVSVEKIKGLEANGDLKMRMYI